MPRFTLYRGESAGIADPAEHLRSEGVKVIAARPGLALIETTDAIADKLRGTLKDWRISKETKAGVNPPRPQIPGPGKRGN